MPWRVIACQTRCSHTCSWHRCWWDSLVHLIYLSKLTPVICRLTHFQLMVFYKKILSLIFSFHLTKRWNWFNAIVIFVKSEADDFPGRSWCISGLHRLNFSIRTCIQLLSEIHTLFFHTCDDELQEWQRRHYSLSGVDSLGPWIWTVHMCRTTAQILVVLRHVGAKLCQLFASGVPECLMHPV